MSFNYDGSSPKQRLGDISVRLQKIDTFVLGMSRDDFVANELVHLAVIRLIEEICEASYWFVKNPNGAVVASRHPQVDFGNFGGLGNVYRHQYALVDYGIVWDDLNGSEITSLRAMLESEL